MDDRDAPDTDAVVVSEAYAAARELLRQAEDDATRMRAGADRYRRQREQEAELIVAKARRLLTMAEERVAKPRPVVDDVAPASEPLDLDAPVPPARDEPAVIPDRTPSGLDAILATAVSNAIHRALPSEP
jgi:hypothetical protein